MRPKRSPTSYANVARSAGGAGLAAGISGTERRARRYSAPTVLTIRSLSVMHFRAEARVFSDNDGVHFILDHFLNPSVRHQSPRKIPRLARWLGAAVSW